MKQARWAVRAVTLCLALAVASGAALCAQGPRNRGIGGLAPVTNGADRVALVIGSSAYPNAPLRDPANDAKAIGSVLERRRFVVTVKTDCTYAAVLQAVD